MKHRLAAAAALALAAQNEPVSASSPLMLEKQGSLFVAGRDVHFDTLSMNPGYPASGTITLDQIYVHH